MVVNHSLRSQLVSSSFFNVPTDWHWHSGSVKTCKGIVSSRVTRHDRAIKKVRSKIVPVPGSNWRTRNKGSLKSSLHAHNSCRNEPSRWANTKDSFKRSFLTLFSVHLPMERFQISTFSTRFATMAEIWDLEILDNATSCSSPSYSEYQYHDLCILGSSSLVNPFPFAQGESSEPPFPRI